jgi:DNA-binding MarR family transcriptional regulator
MKEREYRLLEAIADDETVTQTNLATHLGMAVGSVNWYIKRLIGRGYLKATRMDRTRLRYNLTSEGMSAFTRNATQYMKDSLRIYKDLRQEAQKTVDHLRGEIMDILRLTCIEAGIQVIEQPTRWVAVRNGRGYELKEQKEKALPVAE